MVKSEQVKITKTRERRTYYCDVCSCELDSYTEYEDGYIPDSSDYTVNFQLVISAHMESILRRLPSDAIKCSLVLCNECRDAKSKEVVESFKGLFDKPADTNRSS